MRAGIACARAHRAIIRGMDARQRERERTAAELNRYAFFYTMKDIGEARGSGDAPSFTRELPSFAALKVEFMAGSLRPGAEVCGEAFLSPHISLHRPRAYYPELLLGRLRASAPAGGPAPAGLPHALPVVELPPLPGGWKVLFLYPGPRGLFTRYQHPAGARDALIRDYLRIPLLLPAGGAAVTGPVRFRARLLELRAERLREGLAWESRELEAYALRGLNLFLAVLDPGQGLQPLQEETQGAEETPAGSLFAECRLEPPPDNREEAALEECLVSAVEEVFPSRDRGQRRQGMDLDHETDHHALRFRGRLTALIYRPAFAAFRKPSFWGIFLPTVLAGRELEESRHRFRDLYLKVTERLGGCAASSEQPELDFVHDPADGFWRERGLLRSGLVEDLLEKHPHLAAIVSWLRGEEESSRGTS